MKGFLRFFYKLRGLVLELFAKHKISKLKNGNYRLFYNIPYVSQYASKKLAEKFVEDSPYLKEDSKWLESGAETIDEYIFWAPKLCGMACFKMICKSLGSRASKWSANMPLVALGKEAIGAGCYKKDPDNPNRLIGLLHAPFLKFTERFGFAGKLLWYIGANVVAQEILKNNFIIASVSHEIRDAGAHPQIKSGHLILVHGFKIENGRIAGFYIHNPSGFYNKSQENHFVTVEDFRNCFSGRIIILYKNNANIKL